MWHLSLHSTFLIFFYIPERHTNEPVQTFLGSPMSHHFLASWPVRLFEALLKTYYFRAKSVL